MPTWGEASRTDRRDARQGHHRPRRNRGQPGQPRPRPDRDRAGTQARRGRNERSRAPCAHGVRRPELPRRVATPQRRERTREQDECDAPPSVQCDRDRRGVRGGREEAERRRLEGRRDARRCEEGVRAARSRTCGPARRGGPDGDGQAHGPLFLGPEDPLVPKSARAGGTARDCGAAPPPSVRGRQGSNEGEGLPEGPRLRVAHRRRVHGPDPGAAFRVPDGLGAGPRLRRGRRSRRIERYARPGARSPRGGRDRTGRGTRAPTQDAARDVETAGRGDRSRAAADQRHPRGRRCDERPLGPDAEPARKGGTRVSTRAVRRSARYRRASGRRGDEGTGPDHRGDDEALRRERPPGEEGRDGHPLGKGSQMVVGFVADSRKAYSEGDYVKALDTAIHASDSIADLRVLLEEVAEVREKARALLQTFSDVGADATKFEKSFQEGESSFETGEVERSRAAFTDGIEWGRNLLGSHLRDELTKGEALIEMCRKMEVDPTSALNKFAEAKAQIESEEFREAAASIRAAKDEAGSALAAKLNRALQDAADNVAHAKKLGSDSRDAEALLRQANDRILHGEYDRAMDVVNNALERVESAKVIEKRFIDLTFKAETTIRNGRKFGIDM